MMMALDLFGVGMVQTKRAVKCGNTSFKILVTDQQKSFALPSFQGLLVAFSCFAPCSCYRDSPACRIALIAHLSPP